MKRIVLLCTLLLAAISLVACGDSDSECPNGVGVYHPSCFGAKAATNTNTSSLPATSSRTTTPSTTTATTTPPTTTSRVPYTTPSTVTVYVAPTTTTPPATTTVTVPRALYATDAQERCEGSQLSADETAQLNGNTVRFAVIGGVPTIAFGATPNQYLPISRFVVSDKSLRDSTDDFTGKVVSVDRNDVGTGSDQTQVFSIYNAPAGTDRLTVCE